MSNSYLDPKLYEAARTGNETYIKEHGLISEEERVAFENAANDPPEDQKLLNAEEVNNGAGDLNPRHVALSVPDNDVNQADEVLPNGGDGNPRDVVINVAEKPEGPAAPEPEGPAAPEPEGPAAPEPDGPAAPEPEGPAAPAPEGQHPLLRVTCTGDTVLHIAARFGQTNLAKKICRVGACASLLTTVNDKWETPLHYAAQAGNHDLVRHFVSIARQVHNNADLRKLLQEKNKEGETALYQAVHHQHKDVVVELMLALPDRDLASIPDNNKTSPLYLATKLKALPIVACLCQLLQPNVPGEASIGPNGQTALHAAAISKNKRLLQIIFSWRQEMARSTDSLGRTPLHYAAINNNYAAANILLRNDRASAYIADSPGLYPVHVAAESGHVRVVIELFKQCPDSGELLNRQGKNFLHLAVEAKRKDVVRWVNKNIVKVENALNARDHDGNTPLHLAVRAGDPGTVFRLVLSKKVHLNWVNNDQLTPLDIAFDQLKSGFSDQQNPDYVIYSTLRAIGCTFGKHFSTSVEKEFDQQRDEKEEKKEMKSCEDMAKSMSIGSVLIASAAFAAAFTVYNIYINGKDFNDNRRLKLAFHLFFILDAYAFLCSIISTVLLIEAALPFIDLQNRKRYLLLCASLVTLAAKCFIVAFTTAAYVVLMPLRKWLAILILVVGAIIPLLVQPRNWPNILVLRTIAKYNASRIGIPQLATLLGNILYIYLVLMVLDGRQSYWSTSKRCRHISCSDGYLSSVIVFLGLVFFCLFHPAFNEVQGMVRKAKIKKQSFI